MTERFANTELLDLTMRLSQHLVPCSFSMDLSEYSVPMFLIKYLKGFEALTPAQLVQSIIVKSDKLKAVKDANVLNSEQLLDLLSGENTLSNEQLVRVCIAANISSWDEVYSLVQQENPQTNPLSALPYLKGRAVLKRLCDCLGLEFSSNIIAELFGVPTSSVNTWIMHDRTPFELIIRVAMQLNIPLEKLLLEQGGNKDA